MANELVSNPGSRSAWWYKLVDSPARRSVLQLLFGNGISHLCLIASTPIISRIYTPNDFAVLGLFLSFLGIALCFATLKLELGIVSARSDEEANYLLGLSLFASMVVGAGSIGVLLLIRQLGWFGFHRLPWQTSFFIGPAVSVTASYFAMRQWMSRATLFPGLSRAIVGQGLGRSLGQVGFGLASFGWAGLILGEILSKCVACSLLARRLLVPLGDLWRQFNLKRAFHVLSQNRRFPLFCLPSTLLDTIAIVLPAPLLIQAFGVGIGGAFVLMQRALLLPVSLLGRSVSDVFHQKLATCAANDQQSALQLLDRTVFRLLAMGLLPAVGLYFTAEWLTPLVLGENWQIAGVIAALMVPWALAQFVITPVSQVASVYQSHDMKLIYDTTSILCVVVALTMGTPHGYETTIRALAWANFAAYVLYYILLRTAIKRRKPRIGELDS